MKKVLVYFCILIGKLYFKLNNANEIKYFLYFLDVYLNFKAKQVSILFLCIF